MFQALPVTARLAGVLQDLAFRRRAGGIVRSIITNTLGRAPVGRVADRRQKTRLRPRRRPGFIYGSRSIKGRLAAVERDVLRGEKLRSRGESPIYLEASRRSSISARNCAESRRLAELRRFELARFASSLRRRTGLSIGGSGVSGSLFVAGLPRRPPTPSPTRPQQRMPPTRPSRTLATRSARPGTIGCSNCRKR